MRATARSTHCGGSSPAFLRSRGAFDRGGAAHDDAAAQKARRDGNPHSCCRLCRDRRAEAAATGRAAGRHPAEPLHCLLSAPARVCMNGSGQIWTLIWTFGLMSLFAVGGANSAIPEMHRLAVEVHHWMTDKQFADMFAISQLSPGPNVLIVTLIRYSVAGIFGALAATLAMCGPTAILAYYVSGLLRRSSGSRWPAIIQAALVP